MATLNKNFKVKSGLVVEGATGTINGYNILTESQDGIDFIVDQIGGTATPVNTPDTVVKRDGNGDFAAGTVTVNGVTFGDAGFISDDDGDLVIDTTANGDDVTVNADDIRLNAVDDVLIYSGNQGSTAGDIALTTSGGNIRLQAADVYLGTNIGFTDAERVATQGYVDQAETDAVNSANSYTDTQLEDYTPTNSLDATIDGYGYLKSADLTGYATEAYADQAETDAKAYTDAREAAITTAYESYTDTAVSNLVDGAPALLDTLNELAAAIADNPNYATDVANLVAGKQDTLTEGANIDITNNVISVTGLDTDDVAEGTNLYFTDQRAVSANSGLWDVYGSAAAAGQNAETFAQGLVDNLSTTDIEEGSNLYFTNQRAIDAVGGTITGAIDNLDTDDIEEGNSNLYFTEARAQSAVAGDISSAVAAGDDTATPVYLAVNLADIAKQVATQVSVPTASEITALSWASADFRSAELLVKVAYGSHTEVSKVLLTMDTSNNIAITEYAIVGTNGSASTISADVSGSDVRLRVLTANNNSTVTVAGTLLV